MLVKAILYEISSIEYSPEMIKNLSRFKFLVTEERNVLPLRPRFFDFVHSNVGLLTAILSSHLIIWAIYLDCWCTMNSETFIEAAPDHFTQPHFITKFF